MDAKQFLAEFGHIVNAPGGISRLRELVLQLAISGFLVQLLEQDTDVRKLMASALNQRARYKKYLNLRSSPSDYPALSQSYKIPTHWKWVRLDQLSLYIQRGKGPKYVDHGNVRVISQKCVRWNGFDPQQAKFIADSSLSDYSEERFLYDGDLLWNSTGTGTVGRAAIYRNLNKEKCVADSHITVVRLTDVVLPRYIWCVIASPWVQARIHPSHPESLVSGTTQQVELATSTVRTLPIPYPPLEEQSRIVAKVDELMALCDKLEAQQQERRKLQNALRQSTLQAVASAQSPQELKTSWMRLEANFGRFFSASEDINQFRDAIFYLTLKGKLLNKDSNKIYEENLKYDNLLLPLDWRWSTLKELSNYITSGSRNWKNYLANSGDGFIRSQDIKYDTLIFENPAYVVLPKKTEGKRTLVQKGDILITITGGNVGKCAVVMDISKNSYVSQHIALIRLNNPDLAEFVHLWMINIYGGRGFISQYIYGDKPGLNLAQVGSVPIPVPSTIDRIQIISKLNHYQKMCHCLTNYLASKQELAAVLVIAVISTLTGIAPQKQKDEPVKIPQTELIAPLRLGSAPDTKAQAPLATILAHHHGEMDAKNLWQRFGGDIDAFYAQLKTEVAHGWIQEPAIAEMREKFTDTASG